MPLVELMAVDPKRVGEIWPAAQPLIAKAYAKNDFDVPDDILADLRKGARLLWLAVDTEGGNLKILAAMLTQLFQNEGGQGLQDAGMRRRANADMEALAQARREIRARRRLRPHHVRRARRLGAHHA
jgi:hypothetical protein